MARKKKITVRLAELTKPMTVKKVDVGTKISDFLSSIGQSHTASIRVNAKAAGKRYVLKDGDIITIVGAVSGGC